MAVEMCAIWNSIVGKKFLVDFLDLNRHHGGTFVVNQVFLPPYARVC
jgi:hypothetical protein